MNKSTDRRNSPPPRYSPPHHDGPALYGQSSSAFPVMHQTSTPLPYFGGEPLYVQQAPLQNAPVSLSGRPGQLQPVILVCQPSVPTGPTRTNWSIPKAKFLAILTIVVAVLNLIAFVGIGVTSVFYPEFCIAFVLYLVAGVVGILAAQQRKAYGMVIACLIMGCVSLATAFTQIILRILAIGFGQMLVWDKDDDDDHHHHHIKHKQQKNEGRMIVWVNVAILFVALFAFGLALGLIIIPSKSLCCRRRERSTTAIGRPMAYYQGGVVDAPIPLAESGL